VVTAGSGRLSLADIATASGLPLPTIHRLLRTLVARGYMRQLPNRQYALGFGLAPPARNNGGKLTGALDAIISATRQE